VSNIPRCIVPIQSKDDEKEADLDHTNLDPIYYELPLVERLFFIPISCVSMAPEIFQTMMEAHTDRSKGECSSKY
jgi:hypothetical protein